MTGLVRWLRRDRWGSSDLAYVDRCRWQFGPEPDASGKYWTSILGVINGLLPAIDLLLVAHIDGPDERPVTPYLSLVRATRAWRSRRGE